MLDYCNHRIALFALQSSCYWRRSARKRFCQFVRRPHKLCLSHVWCSVCNVHGRAMLFPILATRTHLAISFSYTHSSDGGPSRYLGCKQCSVGKDLKITKWNWVDFNIFLTRLFSDMMNFQSFSAFWKQMLVYIFRAIYIHICIHIHYKYMNTYIHIDIYIYIHIKMSVYLYICTYISFCIKL